MKMKRIASVVLTGALVLSVVKGGKVQVKLTGAQLKKIGKKSVTMVATKKTAKV